MAEKVFVLELLPRTWQAPYKVERYSHTEFLPKDWQATSKPAHEQVFLSPAFDPHEHSKQKERKQRALSVEAAPAAASAGIEAAAASMIPADTDLRRAVERLQETCERLTAFVERLQTTRSERTSLHSTSEDARSPSSSGRVLRPIFGSPNDFPSALPPPPPSPPSDPDPAAQPGQDPSAGLVPLHALSALYGSLGTGGAGGLVPGTGYPGWGVQLGPIVMRDLRRTLLHDTDGTETTISATEEVRILDPRTNAQTFLTTEHRFMSNDGDVITPMTDLHTCQFCRRGLLTRMNHCTLCHVQVCSGCVSIETRNDETRYFCPPHNPTVAASPGGRFSFCRSSDAGHSSARFPARRLAGPRSACADTPACA